MVVQDAKETGTLFCEYTQAAKWQDYWILRDKQN